MKQTQTQIVVRICFTIYWNQIKTSQTVSFLFVEEMSKGVNVEELNDQIGNLVE